MIFFFTFRLIGSPYQNNEETPVFRWTSELLSAQSAVQVLLAPIDDATVSTATPRAVCDNVVFLVDVSKLGNEGDIKCDDLGAWRNNGVHRQKFCMDDEGSLFAIDDDDVPPTDWVIYHLRRSYFENKSSPDLKKYLFAVQGKYLQL